MHLHVALHSPMSDLFSHFIPSVGCVRCDGMLHIRSVRSVNVGSSAARSLWQVPLLATRRARFAYIPKASADCVTWLWCWCACACAFHMRVMIMND